MRSSQSRRRRSSHAGLGLCGTCIHDQPLVMTIIRVAAGSATLKAKRFYSGKTRRIVFPCFDTILGPALAANSAWPDCAGPWLPLKSPHQKRVHQGGATRLDAGPCLATLEGTKPFQTIAARRPSLDDPLLEFNPRALLHES